MNAVELQTPGGEPTGVVMCSACGYLWSGNETLRGGKRDLWLAHFRGMAELCCSRACRGCGAVVQGNHTDACDKCRDRLWREDAPKREGEALAKAKPRPDYAGPFLFDGVVYQTVGEVLDHCHSHDKPAPGHLWVPRRQELRLDAGDILQSELEDNHHEDAGDGIAPAEVADLQRLLDAWCLKQAVVTWWEDHAEYVPLEPAPQPEGGAA